MKQIIQDLKQGNTILEEVPQPQVKRGQVLIKTKRSLVSLGTERMLVEFGKSNLISKAKSQPDKVKQVLDKIKTDGLVPTLETVFKKLDEPLPLGYCNAGEVIAIGEGVSGFKIGDKVASNGNHAEVVSIPVNLCAKIPANVSYEEGSFAVIGSIALQGLRLVNPTFGETVVVIGLGLIGLIECQLLIANGCNVIGFDFDPGKVKLAEKYGVKAFAVTDPKEQDNIVKSITSNTGADAVVITASSKSNEIISAAANMSRKRGRIVLVGVIGLNISRADFYEKELTFQVSCSYGPGRYDDNYEQKGIDYPLPYVRWTEKRNFEAILNAISTGKLDVKSLITEVVPLEEYNKIYSNMSGSSSIASILSYPDEYDETKTVRVAKSEEGIWYKGKKGTLGIIGAGNFTSMMIVPTLKKLNADMKYISSSKGLSSTTLAKKYGITNSTTDYNSVLQDPEVDAVLITTRHNQHASMTIEALKAGKHVFVEKPLAITEEQLHSVIQLVSSKRSVDGSFNHAIKNSTTENTDSSTDSHKLNTSITVGFNRRFSPFAKKAKQLLASTETPINVIATMNAGYIPPEVWVHDMEVGGGRIIGEACHFVDLITFFTGSKVKSVHMSAMGANPAENTDNAIITLKYENGSQGVINYFANGSKSYSKERIEVYWNNKTVVIDNFREMRGYGTKGFKKMKSKQDKGHYNQFKEYLEFLKTGGTPPIPFEEIINTTQTTLSAIESLKTGEVIKL